MKKCKQCRTKILNPRLKKYCSALCKNEAALVNPDLISHCWCCNEIIPLRYKGAKKRQQRKFVDREHYRNYLKRFPDGRKRLLASPTKRATPEVFTYNQRIVIVYLKKHKELTSSSVYHGYKHTLNALQKREYVELKGGKWTLTEKGQKVNGKIRNFTADLLERIRYFPLRK
jgi:hypothetical protein